MPDTGPLEQATRRKRTSCQGRVLGVGDVEAFMKTQRETDRRSTPIPLGPLASLLTFVLSIDSCDDGAGASIRAEELPQRGFCRNGGVV